MVDTLSEIGRASWSPVMSLGPMSVVGGKLIMGMVVSIVARVWMCELMEWEAKGRRLEGPSYTANSNQVPMMSTRATNENRIGLPSKNMPEKTPMSYLVLSAVNS